MTLSIDRVEDWLGHAVHDRDGEKIGKLEDIVFAEDGRPLLGLVAVGLLGRGNSLVPLAEATLAPDRIGIPYTKGEVKDAPSLDDPGAMTAQVEDATTGYFGRPLREHVEGERYTTARERLRQVEEVDAAERRARDLERLADDLAAQADRAARAAVAAQERADKLAQDHEAAVAEAADARVRHAELQADLPH
jgi:sporulation protein YlmC with PRC-barrel domain